MATTVKEGQDGGLLGGGGGDGVLFYRLKVEGIDIIGYTINRGELPLFALEEITEEEYLADRTGKTICYGGSFVVDKVEAKFGWNKK